MLSLQPICSSNFSSPLVSSYHFSNLLLTIVPLILILLQFNPNCNSLKNSFLKALILICFQFPPSTFLTSNLHPSHVLPKGSEQNKTRGAILSYISSKWLQACSQGGRVCITVKGEKVSVTDMGKAEQDLIEPFFF